MKLTILVLAAALALPGTVLAQHEHGHGVGAKLELNGGKQWQTDGPLRQGMETMRAATVAALDAVHGGKATAATYDTAAKTITAQVAFLIQNCKLDPKADAQLHLVIADVLAASEVMEGKSAGKARADGLVALAQALNRYGQYFAHPGWKPIPLHH